MIERCIWYLKGMVSFSIYSNCYHLYNLWNQYLNKQMSHLSILHWIVVGQKVISFKGLPCQWVVSQYDLICFVVSVSQIRSCFGLQTDLQLKICLLIFFEYTLMLCSCKWTVTGKMNTHQQRCKKLSREKPCDIPVISFTAKNEFPRAQTDLTWQNKSNKAITRKRIPV